jgi:cell division topological specificity factor
VKLFDYFFARGGSAPVARERLQIVLAHERALNGAHGDLVRQLQEEILAVVGRHLKIERDMVQIKLDRGASISTLEIDIQMPVGAAGAR